MSDERETKPTYEWIKTARQNGLAGPLAMLLDVAEPMGPLFAQALWIVQPMSHLVGGRSVLNDLANAFDSPDELARLRQLLDSD